MIGARLRWATGCFVAMAVVAGAGRASSAADARRDLLKARGLKPVGSTYVLASESEIQKKTAELRALRNQLILAAQRQANSELQAEDDKGMMREMLRQRVLLNDQITAFDQQIRSFGGAAPELIARRNEAVSAYNGLGDRIRLLQSGPGADPRVQDRLLAELSRRREGYIQAVLNLRQLVDDATKSYAELADDAAVKEALESLGRNSRSKLKLGPSAQFTANVRLLERIEKSVMSDAVELRKEGGVFWVNATFNGKVTRPMVFDTGASLTMIPAGLAEEIGLKPTSADPVVRCETADGTVVEARRMTIPSMRVGRFTVNAVDCAVMPPGKGNVAPCSGRASIATSPTSSRPRAVTSSCRGLKGSSRPPGHSARLGARPRRRRGPGDPGRRPARPPVTADRTGIARIDGKGGSTQERWGSCLGILVELTCQWTSPSSPSFLPEGPATRPGRAARWRRPARGWR